MQDETIISVKEFRKLAGKEAERFSDEEIVEMINSLDMLASLYLRTKKG